MKEFFEKSTLEQVCGTQIGRAVLGTEPARVNSRPNPIECILYGDESLRRSMATQMHANSPSVSRWISLERGVSAYYSWNPDNKSLIIEWGAIDEDGKASLHDYLNQSINFSDRVKSGLVIRSGHMALANKKSLICLIDSLSQSLRVTQDSGELPIIDTLRQHQAIVIGSDGYPVESRYLGEEVVLYDRVGTRSRPGPRPGRYLGNQTSSTRSQGPRIDMGRWVGGRPSS